MKNNKNEKENKTTAAIIVAVIMLIAIVAGGTYAYWIWRGNVAAISVTTSIGNIGLTLNGGDGVIGSSASAGLAPAACTNETYASKDAIAISYYNETDFPARVTLTLTLNSFTWNNGTKPTSTQLGNIKYALSSSPSACTILNGDANGTLSNNAGTFSAITVGSTKGTANNPDYKLFDLTFLLPANTGTEESPSSKTYYLYFWIDAGYTGTNGSSTTDGNGVISDPLQGINFQAKWTATDIIQSAS